MWIVVVVDHHYPSVFHFDSKEEAVQCYEKQKLDGFGHAVHLAEVENSKYDKEVYEFDENNLKTLDVEWYTSR